MHTANIQRISTPSPSPSRKTSRERRPPDAAGLHSAPPLRHSENRGFDNRNLPRFKFFEDGKPARCVKALLQARQGCFMYGCRQEALNRQAMYGPGPTDPAHLSPHMYGASAAATKQTTSEAACESPEREVDKRKSFLTKEGLTATSPQRATRYRRAVRT